MELVYVELKRENWIKPEMNIRSEEDAILAVKKLIQNLDRELMICIHIATSGRVIHQDAASQVRKICMWQRNWQRHVHY